MQTKKGQSIEDASMQMIEEEIGNHEYDEKEWPIVRRIIHSTADFDFANKNKIIEGIRQSEKFLPNSIIKKIDFEKIQKFLNYLISNLDKKI